MKGHVFFYWGGSYKSAKIGWGIEKSFQDDHWVCFEHESFLT
jgi:hypothetical protein